MILFSIVLLIPLICAAAAFCFSKQICPKELAVIAGTQIVVAIVSALVCYNMSTCDNETWNSRIVSKQKVYTSCSHSYSCHCRESCSGSGKNRSCHQVCDTCYEHSNDWNWRIDTSTGESLNIDRIDRRGSNEPPRWTRAFINEPVSTTHSYTNYIKASPDSLFRHQGLVEKYKGTIPEHPDNVYDYYRLDRFVTVHVNVKDSRYWNDDLMQLNAELGSKKQVNVIVVLVNGLSQEYFYALEQAWIGGKKNDVVLVVDVDSNKKPVWASVMAWESNDVFKIKLRDTIMEQETIERWTVIPVLKDTITKYHVRKPMSDFEYLKSAIVPSTLQYVVTLGIAFLLTIILVVVFHVNETFDSYGSSYGRRNRFY